MSFGSISGARDREPIEGAAGSSAEMAGTGPSPKLRLAGDYHGAAHQNSFYFSPQSGPQATATRARRCGLRPRKGGCGVRDESSAGSVSGNAPVHSRGDHQFGFPTGVNS